MAKIIQRWLKSVILTLIQRHRYSSEISEVFNTECHINVYVTNTFQKPVEDGNATKQ